MLSLKENPQVISETIQEVSVVQQEEKVDTENAEKVDIENAEKIIPVQKKEKVSCLCTRFAKKSNN